MASAAGQNPTHIAPHRSHSERWQQQPDHLRLQSQRRAESTSKDTSQDDSTPQENSTYHAKATYSSTHNPTLTFSENHSPHPSSTAESSTCLTRTTAESLHSGAEDGVGKQENTPYLLRLFRLLEKLLFSLKSIISSLTSPASTTILSTTTFSSRSPTPSPPPSQLTNPRSHGLPTPQPSIVLPQHTHDADFAHQKLREDLPDAAEVPCLSSTSPSRVPTRISRLSILDQVRRGWSSRHFHNQPSLQTLKTLTLQARRLVSAQSALPSKPDGPSPTTFTQIPIYNTFRSYSILGLSPDPRFHRNTKLGFSQYPKMAPIKRKNDMSQHEDVQEVEMADSPMTFTPVQAEASTPSTIASRAFARPLTRSMSKIQFAGRLEALPMSATSFKDRLNKSSKKSIPQLNLGKHVKLSKLEDSRDIKYDDGEQGGMSVDGDGDGDDDANTTAQSQSLISPLAADSLTNTSIDEHEVTPASSNGSISNVRHPHRKRARKTIHVGPLRRSSRLMKPLTEFHKYAELPPELKLIIWEEAIEPRLVYINNRSSTVHQGPFEVQNRLPSWFLGDGKSVNIAKKNYEKRFALITATGAVNDNTRQDFNDRDIVIFEPCHNGCRACHCARNQYSDDDRFAVRFLAVQTDSPFLPHMSEPAWQSVSRSWPNVETLYLMRVAVKGVNKREKAMLRVSPNAQEVAFMARFQEWKKGPGANLKMTQIEFVVVVDKDDSTKDPNNRYQTIQDRLTGLPEDVILG